MKVVISALLGITLGTVVAFTGYSVLPTMPFTLGPLGFVTSFDVELALKLLGYAIAFGALIWKVGNQGTMMEKLDAKFDAFSTKMGGKFDEMKDGQAQLSERVRALEVQVQSFQRRTGG